MTVVVGVKWENTVSLYGDSKVSNTKSDRKVQKIYVYPSPNSEYKIGIGFSGELVVAISIMNSLRSASLSPRSGSFLDTVSEFLQRLTVPLRNTRSRVMLCGVENDTPRILVSEIAASTTHISQVGEVVDNFAVIGDGQNEEAKVQQSIETIFKLDRDAPFIGQINSKVILDAGSRPDPYAYLAENNISMPERVFWNSKDEMIATMMLGIYKGYATIGGPICILRFPNSSTHEKQYVVLENGELHTVDPIIRNDVDIVVNIEVIPLWQW